MNEQDRRLLDELIAQFQFDPDDDNRKRLLDVVRRIDPKGYGNLMKSQCAYEFHMILEAMKDDSCRHSQQK